VGTDHRYVGGPVCFADARTAVCATGNALVFTQLACGTQRHLWTPHNGALTAFAVHQAKRICALAAFGLHPKVAARLAPTTLVQTLPTSGPSS
jgi:hypothetical protein